MRQKWKPTYLGEPDSDGRYDVTCLKTEGEVKLMSIQRRRIAFTHSDFMRLHGAGILDQIKLAHDDYFCPDIERYIYMHELWSISGMLLEMRHPHTSPYM